MECKAVRPLVGRPNFLFAGSDEGARRAAIAYTILGSCRLAGVNPVEYLADVLPKLARGVRATEAAALCLAPGQRGARPKAPATTPSRAAAVPGSRQAEVGPAD